MPALRYLAKFTPAPVYLDGLTPSFFYIAAVDITPNASLSICSIANVLYLVGLLGKLPPESLVVLLLLELVLEGLVALGHQGLHLVPLGLHVLPCIS